MTGSSLKVWYSRKYLEPLGFVFILLGAWTAVVFLPTPLISILLLTLLGGAGVFICHKLKSNRVIFELAAIFLALSAWAYAFYAVLFGPRTDRLTIDSLTIIVPVAVLGTLSFSGIGRKKLAPDSKTWTAFKKVAPFTLLLITPFIIGGLHDYNRRGDTNPPQMTQLKVVARWIDEPDDHPGIHFYCLKGITLDGTRSYWSEVPKWFYDSQGMGSSVEVKIHRGALGYEWLEWMY